MSALEGFLKDMFRFKAPDIEQSVMDMMHNPTPRSSMFPYLFFEEESGLYHMQDGVIGFVLEASPIVGCSSSTYKQISMLFDDVLPEGGVLEVLLLASDNLDIPLDIWKRGRVSQNDVLKKLEEYRLEFLKGYNRASSSSQVSNFRLRDFRLFFSFSLRSKDFSKTVEFRERLRSVLLSIGMSSVELAAGEFLKLSREIINYPSSAGSEYRENDLLSEQIIDLSNPIFVELSGLRSGSNSCASRCYEVDSYPKGFSISQMHNLLGSASDNMQIPCRFAISYVVSNEVAESEQERYKTKGDLVVKQARGLLGRFNKSLEDEGHEWNEIINHNLKNKEKLVRSSMTVLLSAPSSQIDRAEQNLMSLWRQNDFVLKAAFGFHLPLLLGFCPFLHMFLKSLKRKFGLFRTVMSSEPKALMPIHAEWKGHTSGGMIILGRKGQVCNWDSFAGSSNYNVCVTGMSGSGKSMFLQDFVMSHLARGARIFVVDIGRSFEKSCKVMGGDFVEFGTGSKVSLNPFVNIASGSGAATDSAGDMLSMLKMVIAKMAAPKAGTKDIEDATIAESLNEVWEKYKNKADIDKLIQVLNNKGEIGKNLARMLFEFSSKGSYGKFFSGSNTIKFDNQFTVLEFEELRERPELGGVIMQMLSIQIIQQIYLGDRKQRFIILFDEAWYALSNFPMLLASIAKTIRKYNGGLVIGTQGWNDCYGTSLAALSDADKARISVMENSAWRISLKQNINDEQARSRGFEDAQIALIKSLETIDGKYAEMLISKSHDEYFVGRLALDKFSQVLYSSSPKVFASVKSYIDSGMSVADSVEKTMRDIHG